MSRSFTGIFLLVFVLIFPSQGLHAERAVKTVDFLTRYNVTVNGAGPLLVRADIKRERVVMVNTNTSSVSIIDAKTSQVTNIPVSSRVPQYVKLAALSVDEATGNVYVIGNKSLHVVFPDRNKSVTIATNEQYEMVTPGDQSDAFLVGRASRYLVRVDVAIKKVTYIKWLEHAEQLSNLNATPPPPIRKVFYDKQLKQVIALDGFTGTLYHFSAKRGKLLKQRKLETKGGARWHLAGYDTVRQKIYTVIETEKREVVEALEISITHDRDRVIVMPGLTEAVGVIYNPGRREVYVPYDNHPSVHLVNFKETDQKKQLVEIKVPSFGNNASAIDLEHDLLYVSSWVYGDINVIDLTRAKLVKRITGVGIIPHMFNMAFMPVDGGLYIPTGATGVNGSFGAALNVVKPRSFLKSTPQQMRVIYTGWSPMALVELPEDRGFMVFNSESEAAVVSPAGETRYQSLPCRWINNAMATPWGSIYLSYGPHQSYWPAVYIWAAKNGILNLEQNEGQIPLFSPHTPGRRIPRMAQQMVFDKEGVLYMLQNNWGGEKQFLLKMADDVRIPNMNRDRIELPDKIFRETTQRILEYDKEKNWLYIVRIGEMNKETGILQIYDLGTGKVIFKYPGGLTPTDLVFNRTHIYIANFDSGTVTMIGKEDFSVQKIACGGTPFQLALAGNLLYIINHRDNNLQISANGHNPRSYPMPFKGRPDAIYNTGKEIIVTGHNATTLNIVSFDTADRKFSTLHTANYPFGETTVDTDNSAFFCRGQFADTVFQLNQIKQDKKGRLWITDYLSGKLFILQ